MPIKSFKYTLKEYFTFTNRYRKPILLLIVLILLVLAGIAYFKFMKTDSNVDFSVFEKEIEAFEKQLKEDSLLAAAKIIQEENKNYSAISNKSENKAASFDFNPNNLPDSLWRKLGISEKTNRTINNYQAKGGKFYKKEDLKKIYGFDERDYKRLEPYIVIPAKTSAIKKDSLNEKTSTSFHKTERAIISFDLNSVSAEELKSLYGIGDAKANSIIKYRSMLGGFYEKEQLLEVYGIDSLLYETIKNYLDVKTKNLITININTAYEAQLKHPYISKQLAVILVNYRKMHGNFKNLEGIKKLPLINDELYLKLAHYLSVN